MYIAQELRKNSIAEYLLYMWQIEDLIRAYGCSLTNIRREYIGRFDYSEDQKEELADWFGNLIKMMNEEGKRESGHLQINRIVLQDMAELHAYGSLIWNDAPQAAKEGNQSQHQPCHEGDNHLYRYAFRLLQEG